MARLEAVANALFYPTPERVVDMIASEVSVTLPAGAPPRLLDVCAGNGVAARLARAWGLESYGVEIHAGRAATCAEVMTKALHGSYHQLSAPSGSFSVLFLNPPYDLGDTESGERGIRQEIQFLRDCSRFLAPGGLLVFIPPEHIVTDRHWSFKNWIGAEFTDVVVRKFPDPEFDAFKQVVVFGRKRPPHSPGMYSYSYGSFPSAPYAVLGSPDAPVTFERRPVPLPAPPHDFRFALQGINPYDYAPGVHGGCFNSARWRMLSGENDLTTFERPLITPRPGHIAMLLAAGSVNGTEITDRRIVKGSSEKIVIEGVDEDAEIAFKRERLVSRLSVLDLTTGDVETWRADENMEKTREWFDAHGTALAHAVRADHMPIYDGNVYTYDFTKVQAPGVFPGATEPVILEAQKHAAVAVVQCWKSGRKSAAISGEMGVGKTTIAVVAVTLAGFKKVVAVMPTHLVKKWLREADKITKTKGAAMTATKVSDIDAFFNSPTAKFLILSKERAKLGARWIPVSVKRRVRVTREIEEIVDNVSNRNGYYAAVKTRTRSETSIETLLCCPTCGAPLVGDAGTPANEEWLTKTKRKCPGCKSPLWQVAPISARGTTRWPLAKYLNDRYAHRYALVIDEVHQYASPNSDQSRAVQWLAVGSTHILAMTGTLYGGRASSIFHLLYKVDPKFRALYLYTEAPKFVHDHGLLETVTKLDERTSRYGYRKNNSGGRVREIPGVNPAMLNLVLGYTVFLKLADLGYELPPFAEEVVVVDHDPDVLAAAREMASQVKSVLREHPKILGQYLMACLGYPDCPEHAESIVDKEKSWDHVEVASAPAFATKRWAKDEALIKIATVEAEQGLKTLSFFTQTGIRTPIPRVKTHLEAEGLRVAVLDGSVAPDEREEWLMDSLSAFDVLLTNGRLVETGLDLLFATTIVQYGTEYSINTLRQSTRRSWRLGQTRRVKVIYLAYRQTMQEIALSLIARKMRAAQLVDGDDLGGLAQHDEAGHDFLLELARAAADQIA
jgi:superfamily II DNA or RNA helicase